MTKKLVVLAGPDEGRVFALGTEVLLLGRSRATDTHLLDPHVSRVHCQVLPDNGKHVLVDFDSAGGTFVNGKQVNKHVLKAGDLIRIGTTHMQFLEEPVAQAVPAGAKAPAGGAAAAGAAGAAASPSARTAVRSKTKFAEKPGAWAEALPGQIFSHYKV